MEMVTFTSFGIAVTVGGISWIMFKFMQATFRRKMDAKDEELATKERKLVAKDKILAAKDKKLAAKRKQLLATDNKLAMKTKQLASLSAMDNEIKEIHDDPNI